MIVKCPMCGKDAVIPANSEMNLDTYGNSALVKTLCCGKAARAYPLRGYRLEPYKGDATEDDWGRKFDAA